MAAFTILDVDVVGNLGEDAVQQAALAGQFALASCVVDGVLDAVRQHLERLAVSALLDVVGDPGRDALARDALASLPGKEDERDVGVDLTDPPQEVDAVQRYHVVVRDDAVDRRRLQAVENFERIRE